MDISNLCRGCMKQEASWEMKNFDARVVEMFSFCTNMRISEEDRLPQQFCYDCVKKIEASYTFITEAQKVHVTLKNIISRSDTSIIIEPETCAKSTHNSEIKLTLPDYKICSVIEERPQVDPVQNKLSDSPNNYIEETIIETEEVKSVEVQNTKKSDNVCPVCRKSFTSKTWFSKHMQKEHSGKKYACTHCLRSFSSPSQLSYHSVCHSSERAFACSACDKRFKRRKQLSVHAAAHMELRPFACDQCPHRFKTKSILKSHMLVHEKDKSYLCCFCGWSFAQAGNLKVHMRMHTGEKPYACKHCEFRASVASNLRRHEKTHARQQDHACAQCGRRFLDRSNLTRHIRTHTGALPYKCPLCGSGFSDSWKRKAHLMRTHKVPLQDIPRMRMDGRVLQ